MERNGLPELPQKLTLEDRRRLTVTGVQDVESFDENAVVLHTNRGVLIVMGRELHLKPLSVDGGQVAVDGNVGLPGPAAGMSLPVAWQIEQFLWSVGLGAALALVWTLLRAVRILRPGLTHLCDALFGLFLTPTLLLFTLYAGHGRFRLFFFPGIALGAALFFWLPGPFVLRMFLGIFRTFVKLFRCAAAPIVLAAKFFVKIEKNIFSFAKKWGMMNHNHPAASDRRMPPGGNKHEVQTVVADDKNHRPPAHHRRHRHPGVPAGAVGGKESAGRRPGGRGRRGSSGEPASGGRH